MHMNSGGMVLIYITAKDSRLANTIDYPVYFICRWNYFDIMQAQLHKQTCTVSMHGICRITV